MRRVLCGRKSQPVARRCFPLVQGTGELRVLPPSAVSRLFGQDPLCVRLRLDEANDKEEEPEQLDDDDEPDNDNEIPDGDDTQSG